jgi:hypothetical protein
MKIVLAIAVVAAALWVWTHHTTTASSFCVAPPAEVCIERPTTTIVTPKP